MTQKLPSRINLRILKKMPFTTFVTAFTTMIAAALQGILPYVFAKITHYAIEKNEELLNKWLIIISVICVALVIAVVVQMIVAEIFRNKIITLLRIDYSKNIYSKNITEFSKGGKGVHWDNLTNTLDQISRDYFGGFRLIIWSISTLVATFLSIALLNVYLGLSLVAVCVIARVFLIIFDKKLKKKTQAQAEMRKRYSTELNDLTNGAETLFWNNKTEAFEKRIDNSNLNIQNANISYAKTHKWFEFINEFISIVISSGILLVMAIFVFKVDYTMVSIFIGVLIAESSLQIALNKMIEPIISIRRTKPLRENSDYIWEEQEKTQQDAFAFAKDIKVENINFNYGEKEVLKNVGFNIKKGQKIAIVGKSGTGKSTLLKLMLKQINAKSGSIKIDGKNIDSLSEEEYLNNIAYANNHNLVIRDTFKNNMLLFGGKKVNFKELKEMFNLDFIKNKNSVISKDELSTGQQQRVNLARIWVNKKPIVVLDECFGNLDKENANSILQKILQEDITVLLISHHLTPKQTKMFNSVIKL
ncbi:ATP-binding cassette domain-containing protein [Mycoplasma todarodis]|uniref:ATP-binding cassette domain-containing protein n=1 Tax=Mycoplasma todarodis TaxID=1937191 RepID=UPI003B37F7F5